MLPRQGTWQVLGEHLRFNPILCLIAVCRIFIIFQLLWVVFFILVIADIWSSYDITVINSFPPNFNYIDFQVIKRRHVHHHYRS